MQAADAGADDFLDRDQRQIRVVVVQRSGKAGRDAFLAIEAIGGIEGRKNVS